MLNKEVNKLYIIGNYIGFAFALIIFTLMLHLILSILGHIGEVNYSTFLIIASPMFIIYLINKLRK
jgi:hypothetical protein